MELTEIRKQLDEIDAQIIDLFVRRMEASEEVAQYKIEHGMNVYDPVREKAKIENVKNSVAKPEYQHGAQALFNQLMTISRMRQYEIIEQPESSSFGYKQIPQIRKAEGRVAYQGMPGAYGHQAALSFFGRDADLYNVSTFEDVMREVQNGQAQFGVLPEENSSTGIIADVFDLLDRYDNCIVSENVVSVEHALLGVKGSSIRDIRTVYSHPQGILQCSKFLSSRPEWNQVSLKNTAVSAMRVADDGDPSQAAIASPAAAEYYNLDILRTHISDNENNSTRFIIIRHEKEYEENANELALTFELQHESGSLYRALGYLIYNGLNMTRIESRPIQGEKWKYRFFVNLDGSLNDVGIRNALAGLRRETTAFKILGNYVRSE
ncbi:MAG: bifunctional chorismate mutase/prephenate dehydratase [Lachnospiraceae bacterium]|jgi:chorismate mutase/prephenate dehydratase